MFGHLGGDRQRLSVQIRKRTVTPLLRSKKKTMHGQDYLPRCHLPKEMVGGNICVCGGRGIGTTEVGVGGKGGGDLWMGFVTGTL